MDLARLWAMPYSKQSELIHTMVVDEVPGCVFCDEAAPHTCNCHGPVCNACLETRHDPREMESTGGHEIGPLGVVRKRGGR